MRTLTLGGILGLALMVAACGPSAATPSAISSAPAGSGPAVTVPGSAGSNATGAGAAATPECTAPADLTDAQTEGPYYTPGAPERSNLRESGMAGTPLTLTGFVVTSDCTAIAGAKVEIWQADATGEYDNEGYRLRGYVLTGANGAYRIETIVPGEYPGRTEHIHVKVTPPGGAVLTTQLYFPGVAANSSDGIFDPQTLLAITEVDDAVIGEYTFVVAG